MSRRKWQPTPLLLSGKSREQRNLVGYSPWGCKRHNLVTKQQQQNNYVEVHKSDPVEKEFREAWVDSGQWENIGYFLPLRGGGYFPWLVCGCHWQKNDAAGDIWDSRTSVWRKLTASSFLLLKHSHHLRGSSASTRQRLYRRPSMVSPSQRSTLALSYISEAIWRLLAPSPP